MDYRKIYDTFIADRIAHPTGDIRAQIHHIVPIEHGGSNEISNLVRLSVRDHLFAHKLLGRFGMCATATKQMTRKVAAKLMAGIPDTYCAHGRGKASPRKQMNTYINQHPKEVLEIATSLAEQMVALCKDCVPGYTLSFSNGKKYQRDFMSFITKARDYIMFRKSDGTDEDEDPAEHVGASPETVIARDEEPAKQVAPYPEIVLTRDGTPFKKTTIKAGNNTIEDICRPAHKNFILGLYYRFVGPAQKKFFDGICDGSIVDKRLEFYNSFCMTHEKFATERKSFGILALKYANEKFATECKSFGILALKYAIAKVTGCKSGTYAIEDIVKESVEGLRMLLIQNIVLGHLDDGGWKMLDLCPEEEDADGVKLGRDVMLLSRHFETPELSDFMYAVPAMAILQNVVNCVAFTEKRQRELFSKSLPALVELKVKMKPTYDNILSKCCTYRLSRYQFVRAFLIKNAIRAVQKVAAG